MEEPQATGTSVGDTARETAYQQLRRQAAAPSLTLAETQALLTEALAQQEALLLKNQQLAAQATAGADEQFHQFMAASFDSVYKMSPDWSQMYQMVGKEFLADTTAPNGSWLTAYIPANEQPAVLALIEWSIQNQHVFEYEHQVVRADGSVGWTHSRAVPMLDAHGRVVEWLGAARDITERKQGEQEVLRLKDELNQQTQNRYRALFNSLDTGFCLIDLLSNAQGMVADYRFLEVNPAFERQLGLPQVAGKLASEVAALPKNEWLRAYAQVARTGWPVRLEYYTAPTGHQYEVYAARVGQLGSRLLWLAYHDVTARHQAAALAQAGEERLAFLLQLSDALSPLADAVAIQEAVTRVARKFFGADRCYYGELLDGQCIIRRDASGEGLPPVAGTYDMNALPIFSTVVEAGQPIVVEDVRTTPVVDEALRQLCVQLQVLAFVNVPVIKNGEPVGVLCVVQSTPRTWTALEVELAKAVAERAWAAVERASAEEAQRESEQKYRSLFESIDEGFCVLELQFDGAGTAVDWIYREANPAFELQTGYHNPVGQRISYFQPNLEPIWFAQFAQFAQVARTGEPLRFEQRTEAMNRWYDVYAFRVGPAGSSQVSLLFTDITERKLAEQRQAFLLQLSDTLRPLTHPVESQRATMKLLAEQYGVMRATYFEVGTDQDTFTLTARYEQDAVPIPDQMRLSDFAPEMAAAYRAGRTLVFCDTETDTQLGSRPAAYRPLGIRAWLAVPLVKQGHLLAIVGMHSATPRAWTSADIQLLEDVAERTWAFVMRAETEEALRQSEEQLRSFVMASSDTLYRLDADWQYMHSLQGKDFLAPTLTPNATWLAQYIPEADQPAVRAAVRAAIQGRRFFELEHRVFRADGSVGWTMSRAVPVLGPQGELREWFGAATDITARKQAEQALHRAEERLHLALDAAELGTWDWNVLANEMNWNAQHFRMLGLEPRPGPITAADLARTVHPDDHATVVQRLQAAVAENHSFEAEFRILTPQGEVRWMSSHGQVTDVTPEGQVRHLSGVMLDVTERKYAEQHLQALADSLERQVARRTSELSRSRDLLQSVYDTKLTAMLVLQAVRDEAGAIQDVRIVSANKEVERVSGRTDLAGQLYVRDYPGIRAAGIFDHIRRTIETGQPHTLEYYYPHNGFNQWYLSQFVKLGDGVVSTSLNITERKLAEQELLKYVGLLEQSEEVAQLGSWIYELATDELRWSAGMYRLFGIEPGTPVVPAIYFDYVEAEDRPAAERLVRALTTAPAAMVETLRLRVGGEVKVVRVKLVVLYDEHGAPAQVLGIDFDVTEMQRLATENLRLHLSQQQALFEAVQAAQEEERRRISESLHNGLGQLLYATKLQLDRLPAEAAHPAQREAAHLLGEAIRQARALSHELTPALLEEFGLEAALQSICRSLGTRQLHWRCHLVLDEGPALTLPLQLAVYRLAQELAQNVAKHAQATEATLEVELLPAWVVLRVEDNGRGFDPDQTSNGLGLRTLRGRVVLMGGSVHLATAPGHGTQCQVRLPLASPLNLPLP